MSSMMKRLAAPGRALLLVCAGAVASLAVSVAAVQDPPAPQEPPVFGSGVGVVPVAVRAVDRQGRPVTDLRPDEFTVTEDGEPQQVRLFSVQHFDETTAAPVMAGGVDPFPGEPARGRVFLLALGRGRLQPPAKGVDGLLQFVREQLLPTDQVAVMAWNRATDFTTDHASVAALLERFKERHEAVEVGLFMAFNGLRARYSDVSILPSHVLADIDMVFGGPAASRRIVPGEMVEADRIEAETRERVDALLGTDTARLMADVVVPASDLEQVAAFNAFATQYTQTMHNIGLLYSAVEYLRRIEGEKHIIFVTETGFYFPNVEGERNLAWRASDARAAIHYVHTGGMGGGWPPARRFDGPTARTLTGMTGGQFYGNRLPRAIDDLRLIDAATRVQYLLGYYPTRAWDGRFRRIEVRVTRPGVTLYHRGGYFAREELPVDWRVPLAYVRMAAAAAYPQSIADIPMTIRATTPRGRQAGTVAVHLAIDPSHVAFATTGDGRHTATLELAVYCVAGRSQTVGEASQTLDLSFTDARLAEIAETGLIYEFQVPVEAAARVVKVIVYDLAGDRLGSDEVRIEEVAGD